MYLTWFIHFYDAPCTDVGYIGTDRFCNSLQTIVVDKYSTKTQWVWTTRELLRNKIFVVNYCELCWARNLLWAVLGPELTVSCAGPWTYCALCWVWTSCKLCWALNLLWAVLGPELTVSCVGPWPSSPWSLGTAAGGCSWWTEVLFLSRLEAVLFFYNLF